MQVRRSVVVPGAITGALGLSVAIGAPTALAGGGEASAAQQTHPIVRPKVGHRRSTFELTFTLAQAPGRTGTVDTYYREVVSPPAHAGASCSPVQPASVVSGPQGSTVRVALRTPARGWCRGQYAVTVFLQQTQTCGPPVDRPALILCPVTPKARPAFGDAELDAGTAHFTVR